MCKELSKLKHFPEDKDTRKVILEKYADEMKLRAGWIVSEANQINESLRHRQSPNSIIRQAMNLLGNAIVILRIVDPIDAGAHKDEQERTKERVELIRKRWPGIPQDPPSGLREVRNDYEQFDARLDQWAAMADINTDPILGQTDIHENLRRFEKDTLYLWDNSVNLSEVVQWAQQVDQAVSE